MNLIEKMMIDKIGGAAVEQIKKLDTKLLIDFLKERVVGNLTTLKEDRGGGEGNKPDGIPDIDNVIEDVNHAADAFHDAAAVLALHMQPKK